MTKSESGGEEPAAAAGYERNGIRQGERVCVVDVPHMFGTVLRCAESGVQVRWDDGKLGDLVWRDDVGYNAFRLQVVRGPAAAAGAEGLRVIRETLINEAAMLSAQLATCQHDLHKSPIGCPYCRRDKRFHDLMVRAASVLQPSASSLVSDLRRLVQNIREEAVEVDDDGDFCCAKTMEHVADAIEAALNQESSTLTPPVAGD